MWSGKIVRMVAEARGSKGTMTVINPVLPQLWHRLTVRNEQGKRTEKVSGEGTYTAQLRSFCDAVTGKDTNLTDVNYAIANMQVIDDIYRAAGLPLREPSAV